MKNCTYPDDPLAFNHSNPSLASPYHLNLKEPYDNAVFSELLGMFRGGHNCFIDSMSHIPEGGYICIHDMCNSYIILILYSLLNIKGKKQSTISVLRMVK